MVYIHHLYSFLPSQIHLRSIKKLQYIPQSQEKEHHLNSNYKCNQVQEHKDYFNHLSYLHLHNQWYQIIVVLHINQVLSSNHHQVVKVWDRASQVKVHQWIHQINSQILRSLGLLTQGCIYHKEINRLNKDLNNNHGES